MILCIFSMFYIYLVNLSINILFFNAIVNEIDFAILFSHCLLCLYIDFVF